MFRLKDTYNQKVIPAMMKEFGYKSVMAMPKIKKVVVNTGFGKQISGKTSDEQKKIIGPILEDLSLICGQKAIATPAKRAIASFKTRQGMIIGAKVTLRGKKMVDFLERVINLTLPRIRDFRGISPESVDKQGNLTIAVKEHIVFPEILPEKVRTIFGLEITIATSAKSSQEGLAMFRLLGFPIKKS